MVIMSGIRTWLWLFSSGGRVHLLLGSGPSNPTSEVQTDSGIAEDDRVALDPQLALWRITVQPKTLIAVEQCGTQIGSQVQIIDLVWAISRKIFSFLFSFGSRLPISNPETRILQLCSGGMAENHRAHP